MAARRSLNWAAALRDLKDDRAKRADVRCEPVKRYSKGADLCAWRGRSGRRYIFSIYPIADIDASDLVNMVVVGVDADGEIVDARAACSLAGIDAMQVSGATHIHLHSLCDNVRERADVARDLRYVLAEVA